MFEKLKSILRPAPQATLTFVNITGTENYADLPQGFFRCRTASGEESLGYNCPVLLCWSVGTTVVIGGRRITLDVPRESLPLVTLNFRKWTEGIQHVGTSTIIETDALDGDNSTVAWVGTPHRDGVDYI